MTDIVLYGFSPSTFVRTARMTCVEKGVSHNLEPADLASEAYRELHPFGKIPTMRHGDVTLFETSAIARYIDETFPGPRLQPADSRERAVMNQWISACNHYLYGDVVRRYLLQYVFPKGPDGKPDTAAIAEALPDVRHHLGALDAALEAREYLAGDALTLADLFLAPIVFYVGTMPEGPDIVAPLGNLRRWDAAIAARPSFTETVPELPQSDAAE